MNSQDQSLLSDFNCRKQSLEQSETNDISQLGEHLSVDTCELIVCQIEAKSRKYWSHFLFNQIFFESERKKKEKSNLSIVLARKMPKNIQNQVIKMIDYYEGHLSDQLELIHRLVAENKEMKKKIERVDSQEDKQNKQNKVNKQNVTESKFDFEKVKEQKNQRIDNLERSLLDKNKQIGELNKEITNLYAQVKKYKKKIHEIEAKSPVKPNRSKSPLELNKKA